ncbi:MAG: ATP-binding cassette domain-containing protein [Ignisphaera sp.]|uniref:ATP-binding cassette domain-containing protein n=1 Tax=Ignisphaera aggregans TaxID=334771 RepID=A0A7J3MWW4_9CREN
MDIELNNVYYRYDKEWVLENISVVFRTNEVVHIVGSNGSGKTTLMKIASLIYRPTKGYVITDGKDFWKLDEKTRTMIRRHVVYVHEKPILIRGSVIDNIVFGLTLRGINKYKAMDIAKDILDRLGIADLSERPVHKLSIGLAQLVAIVRALVVQPQVLFLDESFANLDEEKKRKVIEILLDLREEGVGIVIASHIENIPDIDIDKRIFLKNGKLVSS